MVLKQSTAAVVVLGPFVGPADGVTPVTNVATPTALRVWKNGVGSTVDISAGAGHSWIHRADGFYELGLAAGDVDTAGELVIEMSSAAAYLPVWLRATVLPAAVYDAIVSGTDKLQADAVELAGQAVSVPGGAGVAFPTSIGTSTHSAADAGTAAATAILATPGNKLATAAGGGVTLAAGHGLATSVQATAIAAKTALIGTARASWVSPVSEDGEISLYAGDDYLTADSRQITITVEDYPGPAIAGATVELLLISLADYDAGVAVAEVSVDGSLAMDGADLEASFEVTAAESGLLTGSAEPYNYVYQVQLTDSGGHVVVIAVGAASVLPRLAVS